MQDHLRDRMYETSPEMFEVLCKMVLSHHLSTRSVQVTPFRQDDGIDIEGVIDEELLSVFFGAQVKRYEEGNTVGSGYIRRFGGALNQADCQAGTYITSSSFSSPAETAADKLQIHLVDGASLASTMVENEIGVEETGGGYEIRDEFWNALEQPEQEDTVPSNEVPLANSFETLRMFLIAIEETDGSRDQIDQYVDDFDSRHADLYGTAGWLLGFVHKDTSKSVNGREVRCWGLTKDGLEYLRLHEQDPERARGRLAEAIREVEIIRRVYAELQDRGGLTYDEMKEKLKEETTLSESSVSRRASTVAQWITVLPEVKENRAGRSKKFTLV